MESSGSVRVAAVRSAECAAPVSDDHQKDKEEEEAAAARKMERERERR
jgi:hypothetical protein